MPTLRQLRSWHQRLSTAHRSACRVAEEANDALGERSDEAIIINDPIIELHAALSQIEGLIEQREQGRPS